MAHTRAVNEPILRHQRVVAPPKPFAGAPSLTAAWSAFLLNARDSTLRSVLGRLLPESHAEVAPLTKAVARALGADRALRRPTE